MPPPPPIVVVIEDQPELGRVIREVLGTEGFDARPVRDAEEALRTLKEDKVEFLVSDLPSIGQAGDDPLGAISSAYPEMPIIIIRDERSDDVPFFGPWRQEGTRVLLRRPFRLDDLVAASREVHAGQTG